MDETSPPPSTRTVDHGVPASPLPAPRGLEHVRRPHEMIELGPNRLGAVYLRLTGKTKCVPDPAHPGETKTLREVRRTMTEFNLERQARKQACRDLGLTGKQLRQRLKAERRAEKARTAAQLPDPTP